MTRAAAFVILLVKVRVAPTAVPRDVEWYIVGQPFSPSCDLAPPRPPTSPHSRHQARLATHRKTEKERQLADGMREGVEKMGISLIGRRRERLVLYKSFNILWLYPSPRLWSRGKGKLPTWALIKYGINTLQRHCIENSKQTFPEMKLGNLYTVFPWSVRLVCLFWTRGRTVSFLGIRKSDLICSAPQASQQRRNNYLPFLSLSHYSLWQVRFWIADCPDVF